MGRKEVLWILYHITGNTSPLSCHLSLFYPCFFLPDVQKDNTPGKENTGDTFVEETTDEPDTKSTQADATAVSSLFNFALYDSSVSYSKEDLTIQKNFETFLASLFAEAYAQNSININFLIESPEKYGIERILLPGLLLISKR